MSVLVFIDILKLNSSLILILNEYLSVLSVAEGVYCLQLLYETKHSELNLPSFTTPNLLFDTK